MSKQRDDTTEQNEPSGKQSEPQRQPGSYYYDDSTGYEIYDPEKDEEEDEDEDAGMEKRGDAEIR